MREIKFRAWDKESKRFTNYALLDDKAMFFEKHLGTWKPSTDRFVLMQYTGLKDKNGVEIYEGDIVKAVSFARCIGFIKYLPEKSAFVLWDYEKLPYRDDFVYLSQFEDGFEILGNIYENPELMEVADDK